MMVVGPRGWTTRVFQRAHRVGLVIIAALSLLVLGSAPASAYTQVDRHEQTRYAVETINLTYPQFLARKADFERNGCRVESHVYDGLHTPGCRKPSPYDAFDWTDDGCSGRSNPISFVISNAYRKLFNKACQLHDFGYRNFGEALTLGRTEDMRARIDERFRVEMFRICDQSYTNRIQLNLCKDKAQWVDNTVRNLSDWNTPAKTLPVPVDPAPGPPPAPAATPTFTVMNTSESPPDGVWFRNSPHVGDTGRFTGHGVYRADQVQLECYAWGDAVGAYADRLWYLVHNTTSPTIGGRANDGFLNAHYIDDGTVADQVVAGVRAC